MSTKAKKIEKVFLLSDDSVNVYGFRLLTSGFLKDRYEPNPIGYRMHNREQGVVLRWTDLKIEGDKITGSPVINLSHSIGQQTVDEVENGFLNAASVGNIVVVEFSDAPELMLPDQTGPTVTKWYPKEISLVDIPGNPNALVQLFDQNGTEINLTDFVHDSLKKFNLPKLGAFKDSLNHTEMEIKKGVLIALNLADNTEDATVIAAVSNLVAKAAKVDTLTTEKADLQKKYDDLVASSTTKKVTDLLEKALTEKRLTKELSDTLSEDYKTNPEGLEKLLGGMKPYTSLADRTKEEETPSKFEGKTYMDLFDSDELDECKKQFPDLFAKLKAEHQAKKK